MRIPHGLRAALAGQAAPPTPPTPDANFENVSLLLHGDGTNGAQNNTFTDGSTNNFTITRAGNTTQGTFSPFSPTGWSGYFDGTGDYLTTAASNENNLGTSDFTIEFWINSTKTTRSDPFGWNYSFNNAGWAGFIFNLSSSGDMAWYEQTSSRISASATGWNNGAWNHVALTRSGNSVRMFLNGTQVGSTYTTSFSYGANTSGFIVGDINGGGGAVNGYISNLRIVKGTAVYTSNFTPPTSPLTAITNTSLLTLQDNRFKDNSTNNFTITRNGDTRIEAFSPFNPTAVYSTSTHGGSGYFDGSGDYLSLSANSAFNCTGDFTFELWVNPFSNSGVSGYQLWYGGASSTTYFGLKNNQYVAQLSGGGELFWTGQPSLNVWTHIALVRSGSTITLYVNGTSAGTNTSSAAFCSSADAIQVGAWSGSYNMQGYFSNVRLVKGTAVYTSNFTPPTAPLTAITNTSLLLNFTNGGIIDNASKNVLETVGNAQISTSVKKFGTGSLAFDGSGDYLLSPPNLSSALGTGDFTVEAWVYSPSTQVRFANIVSSATLGWYMSFENNNQLFFVNSAGVGAYSSVSLPNNTWTHVAACRSGTTLRLFYDGIQVANTTFGSDIGTANVSTRVGYNGVSHYFNGYIDDLRITKGVARYTANFTPPTAAFPDL